MGGAGFTLGQLAAALKGTVDGDAARVVTDVASLEAAGPEDIAFVADGRYRETALVSRAGAFLAADDVEGLPAPVIRCREPRLMLIELLHLFHPPASFAPGVDASARVAPGARVHSTATVGALAVVEAGAVSARTPASIHSSTWARVPRSARTRSSTLTSWSAKACAWAAG